jgi:hypothetical protein
VLLQYQGTLKTMPKSYEPSLDRSSTLIAAFNPESDLMALMERYRTGPFRPMPQFYESVLHDESDVVFGIDLRKWAEIQGSQLLSPIEALKDKSPAAPAAGGERERERELVPPALSALLSGLPEAYTRMPSDVERRKAWIYEVPLSAVHHLREALNAVPLGRKIPESVVGGYDAPVIAGAIKLWLLELDPPLALWEGWDEFRRLYPTGGLCFFFFLVVVVGRLSDFFSRLVVGSGASKENEVSEDQRIQDLGVALQKLPRVHLYVLDAVVKHLRKYVFGFSLRCQCLADRWTLGSLIETTTVKESSEVYITKLALAVGRSEFLLLKK